MAAAPGKKLTPEEAEACTSRLFYKQQERAKQLEAKRQETLESVRLPKRPLTHEGEDTRCRGEEMSEMRGEESRDRR